MHEKTNAIADKKILFQNNKLTIHVYDVVKKQKAKLVYLHRKVYNI